MPGWDGGGRCHRLPHHSALGSPIPCTTLEPPGPFHLPSARHRGSAPPPELPQLLSLASRHSPAATADPVPRPCLFPVPPKMSPCRWASSSAGSPTLAGRGSARGEPWTRQRLG